MYNIKLKELKMGLIIITAITMAISITLLKISNDNDDIFIVGLIGGICVLAFIVVSSVIFINKPFVVEERLIEYETIKEYLTSTTEITPIEKESIIKRIIENNNIIKTHKIWIYNFYVDIFYSEKIANLELIDFKSIPNANINIKK